MRPPVILSFGDDSTRDIFEGFSSKAARKVPQDVHRIARRKLDMLNAAARLDDVKSPPNNRLELLRGTLAGRYSIRINDQWRIVFLWENGNASGVSIMDYH